MTVRVLAIIAAVLALFLAGAGAWLFFDGTPPRREGSSLVIDGSDANLTPEDAKALIRQVLVGFFDPEAARFASLGYIKTSKGVSKERICGYVNGKNRFGGYIGYRPFFYVVAEQEPVFQPDVVAAQPGAQENFRKLIEGLGCPRPQGG